MNRNEFLGIYNLLVGFSLIFTWTFLFFTNNIPTLVERPIETVFHIFAELLTGFMLLASGILLLKKSKTASAVTFLAFGMIIYATLQAIGITIEQKWHVLITLAVLINLMIYSALVFVMILSNEKENKMNAI